MRAFALVVVMAILGVAYADLASMRKSLNSLVKPEAGGSDVHGKAKVVSPKESLKLLSNIGRDVTMEMEYRQKERVTMEARCLKKKNFFETEMQSYSATIKDNQKKLQRLLPRVHEIEEKRDLSYKNLVAAEDRIKAITEAIATTKLDLEDAKALHNENTKHFNGRSKAYRESMNVVRMIHASVVRATAEGKKKSAIYKAADDLASELARVSEPVANESSPLGLLEEFHAEVNTSQGTHPEADADETTHPAAKIISMMKGLHEHFSKAHEAEKSAHTKATVVHKGLIEKLTDSLNVRRERLAKIQKVKMKISKEAKANRVELEDMNKLSDDLNFQMDHAREGMSSARHHLEQHNAMCESLEENFEDFKRQLHGVVEQINTIRKVIETRMIHAEKVLKKVLQDTITE